MGSKFVLEINLDYSRPTIGDEIADALKDTATTIRQFGLGVHRNHKPRALYGENGRSIGSYGIREA